MKGVPRPIVRSMVRSSRPIDSQWATSLASLPGRSPAVPPKLFMSAYSATRRIVTLGPEPPMRMGTRSWIGAGRFRASLVL